MERFLIIVVSIQISKREPTSAEKNISIYYTRKKDNVNLSMDSVQLFPFSFKIIFQIWKIKKNNKKLKKVHLTINIRYLFSMYVRYLHVSVFFHGKTRQCKGVFLTCLYNFFFLMMLSDIISKYNKLYFVYLIGIISDACILIAKNYQKPLCQKFFICQDIHWVWQKLRRTCRTLNQISKSIS